MGKCKKGFKMKDGKCVPKRNSSSGKKGFNPFKMWGSYVGVVALIISLSFIKIGFFDGTIPLTAIIFVGAFKQPIPFLFIAIAVIVSGFLLGWGIHSIFRAMRNRRK